ncbi:MAG: hypothetical protein P1U63_02055 [Coxiellaceae bacterium]|nr:hypothetical protein [Coxiellaceae bacterium]
MRPIIILSKEIADEVAALEIDLTNLESTEQKASDTNSAKRNQLIKLLTGLIQNQLTSGARKEFLNGKIAKDKKIYSLKLNKGERVIAIDRNYSGKQVTILLSMDKHDGKGAYSSPYLKTPGLLQKFLDDYDEQIKTIAAMSASNDIGVLKDKRTAADEAPEYDDLDADGAAGVGGSIGEDVIEPEPLSKQWQYNKCLITPTAEQDACLQALLQGALTREQFIALVTGAPGSGKTLLGSELLQKIIAQLDTETAPKKVFYIAQLKDLRDTVEASWKASSGYSDEHEEKASFVNYNGIINVAQPELLGQFKEVDDTHLNAFFTEKQSKQNKAHKAARKKSTSIDIDFSLFRHECDVMASIDTLDEYKSIGSNHSLLHGDAKSQEQLWQYFEEYKGILSEGKLYHPRLTRFIFEGSSAELSKAVLIVDEALDLSRAQLKNLMDLGFIIIFLGDYHQDLEHVSNLPEFIKQEIEKRTHSDPRDYYISKLDTSHRCAKNIATLGSTILQVKRKITTHGSKLADTQLESALDQMGSVYHCSDIEALKEYCKTAKTAVVCSKDNKDHLKTLLGTALIFTADEIKGLGFPRVIVWEYFSNRNAQSFTKYFNQPSSSRGDITTDDRCFTPFINGFYTAITRAETEVVLVQKGTHKHIKALLKILTKDGALKDEVSELHKAATSQAEWLDIADNLYRKQLTTQAKDIYQTQIEQLEEAGDSIDAIEGIRRRQVSILRKVNLNDQADVIQQTYEPSLDYTDAEDKHTPPSSPEPQPPGDGEEKHTPLPSPTSHPRPDSGNEAELPPKPLVIVPDEFDDYKLTFSGPIKAQSKKRVKKKGKKKSSRVTVTFTQPLAQTQIDAIVHCPNSIEIKAIIPMYFKALLLGKINEKISLESYTKLIEKIIKHNPEIVNDLAGFFIAITADNDNSILMQLLTKTNTLHKSAFSFLIDLSKKDKRFCLKFLQSLSREGSCLTDIITNGNNTFEQFVVAAKTNTLIKTVLFKQLTPQLLLKILTDEPCALKALLELAEKEVDHTQKAMDALYTEFNSTPLWRRALEETASALPLLAFFKRSPDRTPSGIISLLGHTTDLRLKAIEFILINEAVIFDAIVDLASVKPELLNEVIKLVEEDRAQRALSKQKYASLIQHIAARAPKACHQLIQIAKCNTELRDLIFKELSYKDYTDRSVIHVLTVHAHSNLIPLLQLFPEKEELTEILNTTNTINDNKHTKITPLVLFAKQSHAKSDDYLEQLLALASSHKPLFTAIKIALNTTGMNIFFSYVGGSRINCLINIFNLGLLDQDIAKAIHRHGTGFLYSIAHRYPDHIAPLVKHANSNPLLREYIIMELNTSLSTQAGPSTAMHAIASNSVDGFLALINAAKTDDAICTGLFEACAIPMHTNYTPLHFSAIYPESMCLVELILLFISKRELAETHIEDLLKQETNQGHTPLYLASKRTGFTSLVNAAETNIELQNILADRLCDQEPRHGATILLSLAVNNPSSVEKLFRLSEYNERLQENILAALLLKTHDTANDTTAFQAIRTHAPNAIKHIIKPFITTILTSEYPSAYIDLLADCIQTADSNGNTGLHLIIKADIRLALYDSVIEMAKHHPTLHEAIIAAQDVRNALGTTPKETIFYIQSPIKRSRLFSTMRTFKPVGAIEARAIAEEKAPPAGEEAAQPESNITPGPGTT